MFKSRGLLITLEGIDGCGKSTQADLLCDRLIREGYSTVMIREPGGTAVGEDIRQVILDKHYLLTLGAELLLYMAARSELTGQVIIPALVAGKIVLCDRFTDSTLVYQGYGGGADLKVIRALNRFAARGITPKLTFLFDLKAEEAAARRTDRADRMESKDLYFYRRVRAGYLQLARAEMKRFKVVDATKSIDQIAKLVWFETKSLIENAGIS
ncbi:MAG: dTMP kinase [Firmicutes bacterium]|nr:dTMP kinase [Bacillota bacterium]